MDRETRTLLKALVDGQVQLVGAQAKLADGQAALRAEVTAAITRLAKEQARTAAELRELGKRMDHYAAAVVRGFTNGARQDHTLEKRVGAVEARLDTLERNRRR